MDDKRTLLEIADKVAIVTLNAPERRNAIDRAMVDALHADLSRLETVPDLAAVVITGAGDKAFAAGADIAQLKERTARDAAAAINSTLFKRVEEFPLPVIAAVRGFCLGGGCELAIACDLRIAGHSAKFGQPEVNLGVIPGFGGTQRLIRRVGVGKARELVLTGDIIDATEAHRIGLCEAVFPQAELLTKVKAVAAKIASKGPVAVAQAKVVMRRGDAGLPSANELEAQAFAMLFGTADQKEGMAAFVEKRQAAFVGK